MDKKQITTTIAVAIVVGGAGFFGGYKFGKSKTPALPNLQNMNQGQRQQTFGQFRTAGNRTGEINGQSSGFISGEVLSKDDKSITVKTRDNSSKIIFYSASTQIGKTAQGSPSDLEIGKNVTITGSSNSDGTLTAQNIQIRPAMPN